MTPSPEPRHLRAMPFLAVLLVLGLSLGTGVVPAQTPVSLEALGPQPGARVPEFSAADQTGRVHTLTSLLGPKGAMLVFSRSADW